MMKAALTLVTALWFCRPILAAEAPVAVRMQNFTVPPSTGPVVYAEVRNDGEQPFAGVLTARFPEGWKVAPDRQAVKLAPGERRKLPFTISRATDRADNAYPVTVTLAGDGRRIVREQQVVCASTPFFQPKIDGKLKEWTDAIPIAWRTAGKQTIVRTYWNRQTFCLAVEVEEERFSGWKKRLPESGLDAVQFALAPAGSVTGGSDGVTATRYEFVVIGSGSVFGADKCFRLTQPGDRLSPGSQVRPLPPEAFKAARVKVKRSGALTRYEIAIPFAALAGLRPMPGREYCFSLLVHDPDGTGLRDLGAVMNLTDRDRPPLAWSRWPSPDWPVPAPWDNKIEFGFCSSIH